MHPLVFDACYHIPSLPLFQLVFNLHGFGETHVATRSGDVCRVISFSRQLGDSVYEIGRDGNRFL